MKASACIFILLFLSGCTTIHFDNGDQPTEVVSKTSKWHHNVVLDLVEVSPPVDLAGKCGENWSSVKTEQTFLNGLTASAVSTVLVPFIWYPKTVTVSCD